jgi:hypothetical protein
MKRILKIGILLALGLFLAAPAPAADVPADAKKVEKTLPFKPGPQKIDVKVDDITIDYIEVRNWPDADDFAAGDRDPNDTKMMWVIFTYSNRGDREYKCRYTVTIRDPNSAETWAENDSTRSLDAWKMGDTNRFGVRMKTHRYRLAKTMKLGFEIWKK